MTISNKPTDEIDHGIDGTMRARMLNLRSILSWSMMVLMIERYTFLATALGPDTHSSRI